VCLLARTLRCRTPSAGPSRRPTNAPEGPFRQPTNQRTRRTLPSTNQPTHAKDPLVNQLTDKPTVTNHQNTKTKHKPSKRTRKQGNLAVQCSMQRSIQCSMQCDTIRSRSKQLRLNAIQRRKTERKAPTHQVGLRSTPPSSRCSSPSLPRVAALLLRMQGRPLSESREALRPSGMRWGRFQPLQLAAPGTAPSGPTVAAQIPATCTPTPRCAHVFHSPTPPMNVT
jgi:hypothetical protein